MTDGLDAVRDTIAADWVEFDRLCQLTPAVSDALMSAPIMRELVPAEYGGRDGTVLEWFRAGREIARMDGSCGWVAVQGAAQNAMVAAQASPAFARAFFAHPQANMAATIRGNARVRRQGQDTFTVSGTWEFGSGATGATYLGGVVTAEDDSLEGHPLVPSVLVRTEEVEILPVWNPVGLRGTGSHHFRVKDAVIPRDQLFPIFNRKAARLDHRLASVGASNILIGLSAAAVQVGIARHALDLAREILASKSQLPVLDAPVLAEPTTVRDLASAEGQWLLTNAGLEGLIREMDGVLDAPWEEQRPAKIAARLAGISAVHAGAGITRAAYEAAGTDGQVAGSALERCFRDANVLTAHISSRSRSYLPIGRAYLGVPQQGDWF
ncbi:MAG: hypothetical protein AB7T37_16695, partial [Dehalococcoidia bacterium]